MPMEVRPTVQGCGHGGAQRSGVRLGAHGAKLRVDIRGTGLRPGLDDQDSLYYTREAQLGSEACIEGPTQTIILGLNFKVAMAILATWISISFLTIIV